MVQASDDAPQDVTFQLFTDSSTQKWGIEMMSTTLDLMYSDHCERRRLPIIAIDRSLLDSYGKTMVLLWQLWLAVGPELIQMRWFIVRVLAICSDMGVERFIVSMLDMLPLFMQYIDPNWSLPPSAPKYKYLFGNALQAAGWKHKFDLLVRRGLASLYWFPNWLDLFKSVVQLLRDDGMMKTLTGWFRKKGKVAVAAMFEKKAKIAKLDISAALAFQVTC